MRNLFKLVAISILVLSPLATSAQTSDRCVVISSTLSRGSAGAEVRALQSVLATLGFLDASNVVGAYGPLTEAAVRAFQASRGISQVGTVGPQTRAALADCSFGFTTQTTQPASNCPVVNPPTNCVNPVGVRQNGCTVGWQCSVTVLPQETFTATPATGVAPLVVRFTGIVTSANAGFCQGSFCAATLNFGDGSTGAVPLPNTPNATMSYDISHTYQFGGPYTATLYQGPGGASAPLVGAPISLNFTGASAPTNPNATGQTLSAQPNAGSVPLSVTFVIGGVTNATGYTVDFGDGTYGSVLSTGSIVTAAHTYTTTGLYTARLRAPLGGGSPCQGPNCTVVAFASVSVTGTSVATASLVATPNTGLVPMTTFISANGASVAYEGGVALNFGDGTSEIFCNPGVICGQRNVNHTYTAPGNYTLQLIAVTSSGNIVLRSTTVTATAQGPTSLSATPTSGSAPLEVTFRGNGGGNTYVNGVILQYGDGSVEEFCPANQLCGERTKTHTYNYGNTYAARLIGLGAGAASSTIGGANVTVTGGPLKIEMRAPTGTIRKGDSVSLSWFIAGTKPASGSVSFDLYTQFGARIGTILSISQFQTGSATWKVPSVADTGCSQTQPNGLCGVNLTPGTYEIRPVVTGVTLGSDTQITATPIQIIDRLVNPGELTVTAPAAGVIGNEMQIKYRVAYPPTDSAVALWLAKATGERVGLIQAKFDADSEIATHTWLVGEIQNCLAAVFNSNIACNAVISTFLPGVYAVVAELYSPANADLSNSSASTVFHARATSTAITIRDANAAGSCLALSRDLAPGDRDGTTAGEVSKLQEFLKLDPEIYPEAIVNGVYGNLTRRAVERFQAANGIVSSGSPESSGYGAVGPKTRAAIATKCGNSTHLFQATPSGGRAPLTVSFAAKKTDAAQTLFVDFGDGATGTMVAVQPVPASGRNVSVSHTYATNGTYIARLYYVGPIPNCSTTANSNACPTTQNVVGTATVTVSPTATAAADCAAITSEMGPDSTDASTGGDVSRLQQFLASKPALYPQGLVTGFYGPATTAAVKRYQAENGIAQLGNVGPATLAAIRCQGTTTALLSLTPTAGTLSTPIKFTTSVAVNNGSYRIDFGDGQSMWLTEASATHTYAAAGTYTAKLVRSIGNCYGLTGDEMRLCEIGNSNVLATVTITITTTPTTTTPTPTGGAVTGSVSCTTNSGFQMTARVTLADGSTRDFKFDEMARQQTLYADFAAKPTSAIGLHPTYWVATINGWRPNAENTETGRTAGSISFTSNISKRSFLLNIPNDMECSVSWH